MNSTTEDTKNTEVPAALAIKERPILFSGEMVRAILDGRKTQTRRVINPQPPEGCTVGWSAFSGENQIECRSYTPDHQSFIKVPYGRPGDRLWVKETFYDSRHESRRRPWMYRADISVDEDLSRDFNWKPPIFMPRKASRITLEIVRVRVERLQEISNSDAIAEGVYPGETVYNGEADHLFLTPAQKLYVALWESINGKTYPWKSNPWVWVVEFKNL